MPVITAYEAGGPNVLAFLEVIANSELGAALLAVSDNGYNVLVGSTPAHPLLFSSYADHPRIRVPLPLLGIASTAAGRYQLLERYFDVYQRLLRLADFSPLSQDRIAVQQIREARALPALIAGDFITAVSHCAHLWASLPGAGYGQHEHAMPQLVAYYAAAGGKLA
jgi:muramidase (phage lysozyme)